MEDQKFAPDYQDMIQKEEIQISSLKIKKKVKSEIPDKIEEEKPRIIEQSIQEKNQVSKFQKSNEQYIQNNIKDFTFRQELRTKPFRDFQNTIKSVLMNIYCQQQREKLKDLLGNGDNKLSVLDIGCGKGGDLTKWAHNRIGHYVGIDPSQSHLDEAQSRFNFLRKNKKFHKLYIPHFKCASGADENLHSSQSPFYDVISSQFVLHYMFDCQKNAEQLFQNIGQNLVDQGFFFCIIPDSNVLVKRLRTQGVPESDYFVFGNPFYKVKFESKHFPKEKQFGISYGFYLEDAIGKKQLLSDKDEMVIYTEEYLIVDSVLESLAQKNNLSIIRNQNLIDFYAQEKTNFEHMFKRLQTVEQDLWEVSHLYKVVVMQKHGGQDAKYDRNWAKFKIEQKRDVRFK